MVTLFIIVHIIDAVLSVVCFSVGAVEANLLLRPFAELSPWWFVSVKMSLVLVVAVYCYSKEENGVLAIGSLMTFGVVLWNYFSMLMLFAFVI